MLLVVAEDWPAAIRIGGHGIFDARIERRADGVLACELPPGKRAYVVLESDDGSLRSPILDCGVTGNAGERQVRTAPRRVRKLTLSLPEEVLEVSSWTTPSLLNEARELCLLTRATKPAHGGNWRADVHLIAEASGWLSFRSETGTLWAELPSLDRSIETLPIRLPSLALIRIHNPQGHPIAGATVECPMQPKRAAPTEGSRDAMELPFVLGFTDAQGGILAPKRLLDARSAIVTAPGHAPWSGKLAAKIVVTPSPEPPLPAPPLDKSYSYYLRHFAAGAASRLFTSQNFSVDKRRPTPPEPGTTATWNAIGESATSDGGGWRSIAAEPVNLLEPDGHRGGRFLMGAPGWTGGLTFRSDRRVDFSTATALHSPSLLYVCDNAALPPGVQSLATRGRGPIVYVADDQAASWHVKGAPSTAFPRLPATSIGIALPDDDPRGLMLHCEVLAEDPAAFAIDEHGFALVRRFVGMFLTKDPIRIPLPRGFGIRIRSGSHFLPIQSTDLPSKRIDAGDRTLSPQPRPSTTVMVYSPTTVRCTDLTNGHTAYRVASLETSLIVDLPPGTHVLRNESGTIEITTRLPLHIETMQ